MVRWSHVLQSGGTAVSYMDRSMGASAQLFCIWSTCEEQGSVIAGPLLLLRAQHSGWCSAHALSRNASGLSQPMHLLLEQPTFRNIQLSAA